RRARAGRRFRTRRPEGLGLGGAELPPEGSVARALGAQLVHQLEETFLRTKRFEQRILLEEGMAGKPIVSGVDQPVERRLGLPDQGICAGDVVLRMMVVTVRFSVFDRLLDFTNGFGSVSGERRQDRAKAVEKCHALLARFGACSQVSGLR